MQRIAILGVGLIGGSLGMAWQNHRPDLTLVGYDRPEVLTRAIERGAIHEAASSLAEAIREADVIVLATPLSASIRLLSEIAPHVSPGTLVTDVGSVKAPIVRQAQEVLPSGTTFIGGHPMAGAEHSGIEYADPFLFENATYVLCPPEDLGQEAFVSRYKTFIDLVESTGARVLLLDAERHDRIAATVSHLPQLVAVSLMNVAARGHDSNHPFLQLAAGGFRDLTRIASSPFGIWRDILIANQGPVLDALGAFSSELQRLRNRLIEEDLEALEEAFEKARTLREAIPRDTRGFLHPLVDVFVFVEDQPGALYHITRLLYEAGLSIKDIELLKLREGTGGTFRLGFAQASEADRAVATLTDAGYRAYRP